MTQRLKIIPSFIFLLFLIVFPVRAQTSTSVTVFPTIISLSLSPGTTTLTDLTIVNNSDVPLPVRLQFEPLTLSDDASPLPSIGSWISFSKNSLLIPARTREKVVLKIALPKKIALGGYYGMVYLEPLPTTKSSSRSEILTKIGVLILGSIGVQDVPLNSIDLQKPQVNAFISESRTLAVSYQIKNNSLNHISAKPYVVIHPLGGTVETAQFDERLVFPGKKRGWQSSFTVRDAKRFYYMADLYVSIGNGMTQKKSFSFVIFPVQQAIILVLCIAGSISIFRKRKQIRKAFEIIMKG